MKTVADYIKLVLESEASVNTVSSGAIATKEVPLGGKGNIQKRKPLEEGEQEGDKNDGVPEGLPDDHVGKDPMRNVYAPDVETGTDNGHMFHQKQALQQNYS